MSVIECKNVSVIYKTGDFKSIGLKEYVVRRLKGNFKVKEFYADKNVTFSLEKGDMLGIIGTNGAGKSTILKAITGIMQPAEGKVKTKGRIAAFLELASGFDPEMTIKENTYLRGAMLGYTKDYIDEKYDDIIKFAELEKFEDYTFKQLSSGMKSRLAFAIASMCQPEIIILDEVLSVGDGAFRKKSKEKMMEILESDVTGILVSHSVGQVRELCNKILWLDHGNQIAFTNEKDLYLDAYEEFLESKVLPRDESDIHRMAAEHQIKVQARLEAENNKEAARLEAILEEGEKTSAVYAAINILQKNCPEVINKKYLKEYM
ncbi:ABC-2 type transport system ATP-binding protein [Butyrivibrio sp. ob235]|uniref:ABC transporter ATP-binding protein n=1 Tax=Butyrivibrio sp. ob235 TaxID=1761780 RepID=UPI0008CE877B|nr:ABC transporter ATP-binding protein [Butyrivibrio sp. ob235]SEL81656.1 ABC-2 type transport system ATP-binding protein [Butyrivibrio sp. ob235]